MKTVHCNCCKKELMNDEVALNVKMFGKQIGSIYCYRCLSHKLGCETTELIKISDYYKRTGCILFKTQFARKEISNA